MMIDRLFQLNAGTRRGTGRGGTLRIAALNGIDDHLRQKGGSESLTDEIHLMYLEDSGDYYRRINSPLKFLAPCARMT
jgi:hypothetical protein